MVEVRMTNAWPKLIATSGGIGFINKGAGTAAAIVPAVLYYLAKPTMQTQLILLVATFVAGVWSAAKMNVLWKHDDNRVVIDEVNGMQLSLLLIPLTAVNITIAFILFRLFDIWKPLGIRKMEKIPGGWGVMADDVLAGVYANIGMQILLLAKITGG